MRLRSRDVGYNLIVAGLALLLLLPALTRPSRLVYPSWSEFSDLTLIHWPKVTLIRESLAQGDGWPLWASYGLSGQPLAANQLAMLFYPPALLLLAGPLAQPTAAGLAWAFSLFYALHLAWAGIGTYWLVRGVGRRPESALLAAAIVTLSGKLAAHTAIGHASLVAAIAWTPWALAFLHRALTRRSLAFALLTGVALAGQATTHTYALVYTAYGLVVYAASYLLLAPAESRGQDSEQRGRRREALSHLPRLAAIPVTAVLLGAAQLLPLLEMAPYSNRSFSFAEATLLSLSPGQTLAGLLFPTASAGHEWTIYPALLTLGLAAASWLGLLAAARSASIRRQWPVIAFSLLVLAGVILALGSYTPLYRLAYTLLPGLRWMRTPARLWFFVTLGLAVLAAYGLEAWGDLWRSPRLRRAVSLPLVAAIGCAVTLSLGVMVISHQYGRSAWGLALFGALSGVLLLWAARAPDAQRSGTRRRPTPVFVWLAIAVIVADLLTFDLTLFRFPSLAEVSAPGREAAAWLAAQPGLFRTYSPSYSLPQPAAIQAGLQEIDGVEPVHLARYDQFMAAAGGYDESVFSVTIPPFHDGLPQGPDDLAVPDLRLLGLLNGRYLASAFPLEMPGLALRWQEAGMLPAGQAGTLVYENSLTLPRAFVVHHTEVMSGNMDEEMARLEAINLHDTALVAGGRRLVGSEKPTTAQMTDYSPNRVVVDATLDEPGLLVLGEIWYPGWQALDNGRPVPMVRTDAILRGVYLETGSHTIELVYAPSTVQVGLIVSGATALALVGYTAMCLIVRWRRR
jgi:hypothetical protein